MVDAKLEYLKMVQGVIARLAGNSFFLKGWTVTLVAALFAFAAKDAERSLVVIVWIPLLVFAALDVYYLWQERLYRKLYEEAAQVTTASGEVPPTNMSMSVQHFKPEVRIRDVLVSAPIWGFYLPIGVLVAVVTVYLVLNPAARPVPIEGPKTITITIK